MLSNNKKDKKLNKKRGKRLQECRKLKGLSQSKLAEAVGYEHPNSISQLENGSRPLTWDKVVPIAKCLNVNPAYIMCETDIPQNDIKRETLDYKTFGNTDSLFLHFIIALGHSLKFHVVKLYDGKKPIEKHSTTFDRSYFDWNSLQQEASLDQLKEFCLSDTHCILLSDDTLSEVIIVAVTLDNVKLTYGQFVFTINRMYDYIHFTFNNMEEFKFDLDMQHGGDLASDSEIKETRNSGFRQLLMEEALAKLEDTEITAEDGSTYTAKVIDDEFIKTYLS